jgi:hypothetical protein
MDKFLALADSDRADVIKETAANMQLHPTPVEKDFWVCFLLRELFALDCVKDQLIFKGGTSLSKGYGIIERFSEDIDLSVHASTFGIDLGPDFTLLGPSERRVKINQLYKSAAQFVDRTFISELKKRLEQSLPEKNWRLQLYRRGEDNNIILFNYPRVLQDNTQTHYTKREVQIEIGVRAEHEPAELREVQPYIAEQFPQLFEEPKTTLKVLAAKRTFWEKVTIFHAESFKREGTPLTRRFARHTYDLHQLMQAGIGKDALEDLDLLKRVAQHKALFHASANVDYSLAYTGELRLAPQGSKQQELADDYAAMRDFFMGEPPAFSDILKSLQQIEQQTNSVNC